MVYIITFDGDEISKLCLLLLYKCIKCSTVSKYLCLGMKWSLLNIFMSQAKQVEKYTIFLTYLADKCVYLFQVRHMLNWLNFVLKVL